MGYSWLEWNMGGKFEFKYFGTDADKGQLQLDVNDELDAGLGVQPSVTHPQ